MEPLLAETARMTLLLCIANIAKRYARVKSTVQSLHVDHDLRNRHKRARACLRAMLRDTQWFSVLGGREGAPLSLASSHAAAALRFMNGSLSETHVVTRCTQTKVVFASTSSMAFAQDGSVLHLPSDLQALYRSQLPGSEDVFDGYGARTELQRLWSTASNALPYIGARQIWVAEDGFVFIPDMFRGPKIVVLTPDFCFQKAIGDGVLTNAPHGVCANSEIVAVAQDMIPTVTVFSRHDGSLLRRIGDAYPYDGVLKYPRWLTFVPSVSVYARGACHLAVADMNENRVSVFDIATAQFIRHVDVTARHKILNPTSVAFSSAGEMVLTQTDGCGGTVIVVISADGSEARTLFWVPSEMYELSNAVIRDGAIYVHVRSYTGHHEDGIYKIQ